MKKLREKWVRPCLMQAQFSQNVWRVRLVSRKLMNVHVNPCNPIYYVEY